MTEELEQVYEKLTYCFENRKFADLRMTLIDMEPFDIATFMEENLDEKEELMFFRLLPKDCASDVFVEIDTDTQERLIKAFTDKELKAVVDDMFLDDTVDIIEEMPANVVKRILKSADPENRKQINALLEYPEDSAGSIMTTEYISLSASMTVEAAFDKIRATGINKEIIYTCYVTNNRKVLIGVTTVKSLLLADKQDLIENIMDTSVVTVETMEDKEEVAKKLSDYDFLALPVIDKEGCLVGIVTVDDAVDVIEEEATEDIHKMAAIMPNEKPYLKQSIFSIWKSRIPWLLILLITSTFTSLILSGYEEKISVIGSGVLLAFVPMLMGSAGNAGNQTSVTIIRAIATDEVTFKDIFRIILKEMLVALLVGITVGVVCFLKVWFLDKLYNPNLTIELSLLISGISALSIVIAKLVGCLLPLFAKQCRLDPAVVASPLMTTIVDALTLIIYCTIAIAIFA